MPWVLQVVWPVTEPDRKRAELIAEAEDALIAGNYTGATAAVIIGPPLWTIRDAETTPGWESYAPGVLLVGVMAAEPRERIYARKALERAAPPLLVPSPV